MRAGFSLIELLITLAIVGILVAVAVPSYRHHLMKTHRVDGQIALMDLAARMERYYSENNHSFENASIAKLGVASNTPGGYYTLSLNPPTATSYLLQATPRGTQKNDTICGALTFDQLGQKGRAGSGTVAECW